MRDGSIIAVVPARLGSKRVRLKSLRLLNGKPLIEYILSTLKSCEVFDEVFINSDSVLFQEIADRNGVNFYEREPSLATSESLIDDYLYDFMKNQPSDFLAVVNPTSPFIDTHQIEAAVKHFLNNSFETMLCCESIQTHCFYRGQPVNFSVKGQHPRSQDLEPVLALNFAITMWDCKAFIRNYEQNGFGVYTGEIGFFVTDGMANIDIDYEEDFQMAEFVARFVEDGKVLEPQYDEVARNIVDNQIDPRN